MAVGTKDLESIQVASRGTESGKEIYVTSTAYTAYCNGCSGTTATGLICMQIQMQRLLLLTQV